jgi:hypothetical protein
MKLSLSLLAFLTLTSTSYASSNCQSIALKIEKNIDQIYTPKLFKVTKISAHLESSNSETESWSVNYLVPNAGGQTAYLMRLEKNSCLIQEMQVFVE